MSWRLRLLHAKLLAAPTRSHVRGLFTQTNSTVSRNHLSAGLNRPFRPGLLAGIVVAGGSWYFLNPESNCDEGTLYPDSPNPRRAPYTPIQKDTQGESVFTFDGSTTLSTALIALTSWTWPEPFKWIQDRASILVLELSRGPGSLWNEIVDSPPSSQDHPEYEWEAEVRLGDELCMAERAFLRNRKRKMRTAFAELFGVAFHDIDERDLPIVAIAGSGGGFRAMVNTTGALKGAQDTGIFDCISYIAGISGSCWALAMMYSGVTGSPSPSEAQKHMRSRIQTPYLDISNFDIIISPPFNKYLLSGLLHKVTAPGWGNISLTDIYGTLLSTRLLVPDDIKKLDPRCLSLHQFRRFIDDGSYPMPIMTAISRHLRQDLENKEVETKKKERRSYAPTRRLKLRREAEELEAKARWLWFEWSPYEVGCDELGAWIPSWALGRRFEHGRNIERRPELSLTLLSGIFGSAFCASLQHYFLEVRPLLRDLPLPIFNWLDNVLVENEKEFDVIHPVSPTGLPNFVKGLEDQLRYGSPDSITEAETLRFMDAGAELNIPYYPLLRRGVDCIIALDASADSQDLWFTRAEEYAARRGLQTWPKGARWPKVLQPAAESSDTPAQNQVSDSDSRTNQEIASTKESDVVEQADHQKAAEAPMGNAPLATEDTASDHDKGQDTTVPVTKDRDIGSLRKLTNTLNQPDEETKPLSAYVWIGSSTDNGSSRVDNLEEEALASRDGIGIVYMPLIPNEEAQRRYGGGLWHPLDVSTWRFELQCEETDKLLTTAEMNFKDGHQKIARVLKVMWMRKRNARLEKEHQKWKHDFDRLVDSTS
ncbi:phospholipase A2 [Rhizoctonia solani AG-3 Rhs1AP]|uniref:Lysophospholipase n=2 Tax=Rhizoctonia solani AG-3 TaxID=1086053 RepID=A0A074SF38_9AGAM|nr:phospholipase A2 [Rhizoctonia solani AG-3 Rhs1AP]KEP55428.1 phospholipase A2 [Rhizoctonia solani 123E]